MQLDALMGNDISVISHFTFSQSAPEPFCNNKPFSFSVFYRRKFNKTTLIKIIIIITFLTPITGCIVQYHNCYIIFNSYPT